MIVGSLAGAIERHGDLVRRHLGQVAEADTNPFTALATAFAHDGVFVYVPRDVVVDELIQVVFVATGGARPVVSHTRALYVIEANAQLSLVEQFAGAGDRTYWANVVTEWFLGENAVVDAYRVQRERTDAFHKQGAMLFRMMGLRPPPYRVDFHLVEGELEVGDHRFQVIYTPGHAPGSICLHWPEAKALFTGDVIFSQSLGRTDLPGGRGALLKASIDRLTELGVELLLPGHGPVVRGKAAVKENFYLVRSTFFRFI